MTTPEKFSTLRLVEEIREQMDREFSGMSLEEIARAIEKQVSESNDPLAVKLRELRARDAKNKHAA